MTTGPGKLWLYCAVRLAINGASRRATKRLPQAKRISGPKQFAATGSTKNRPDTEVSKRVDGTCVFSIIRISLRISESRISGAADPRDSRWRQSRDRRSLSSTAMGFRSPLQLPTGQHKSHRGAGGRAPRLANPPPNSGSRRQHRCDHAIRSQSMNAGVTPSGSSNRKAPISIAIIT